jgi:hypothetical protein
MVGAIVTLLLADSAAFGADIKQTFAGCVSMEGLVFYKRPTGALKFPDLVTILNDPLR